MDTRQSIGIVCSVLIWFLFFANLCWGQGIIFWDNPDGVYSMQPDEEKPARIWDGSLLAASPDGNFLLVGGGNLVPDLGIFDVKKNQIIEKIQLEQRAFLGTFDWSPDGRWIAYTGTEDKRFVETAEIFLFKPDGRQFRQLTFDGGAKISPLWHPNGHSIFYQKFGEPKHKVWEIQLQDPNRPQERKLFHEDAVFFGRWPFFDISPSGEEIAYCSFDGVYIADIDGLNHRRVTPAGFDRPFQVDWSPNGSQLVFSVGAGLPPTSYSLYIYSRDTGAIRRLINTEALAFRPMWVRNPLAVEPAGKLTTTWGEIKSPPTR